MSPHSGHLKWIYFASRGIPRGYQGVKMAMQRSFQGTKKNLARTLALAVASRPILLQAVGRMARGADGVLLQIQDSSISRSAQMKCLRTFPTVFGGVDQARVENAVGILAETFETLFRVPLPPSRSEAATTVHTYLRRVHVPDQLHVGRKRVHSGHGCVGCWEHQRRGATHGVWG